MRKFEEVVKDKMVFPDVPTQMPERSDSQSAGYDLRSKENYILKAGESHVFWTDVKAHFFFDNVLHIYARSGNGCKHGIILRNNVGVIDASYYNNVTNDGNIGICLYNSGAEDFEIKIGDKIAQGIFERYLVCDDDKFLLKKVADPSRIGGFGSTGGN